MTSFELCAELLGSFVQFLLSGLVWAKNAIHLCMCVPYVRIYICSPRTAFIHIHVFLVQSFNESFGILECFSFSDIKLRPTCQFLTLVGLVCSLLPMHNLLVELLITRIVQQ